MLSAMAQRYRSVVLKSFIGKSFELSQLFRLQVADGICPVVGFVEEKIYSFELCETDCPKVQSICGSGGYVMLVGF